MNAYDHPQYDQTVRRAAERLQSSTTVQTMAAETPHTSGLMRLPFCHQSQALFSKPSLRHWQTTASHMARSTGEMTMTVQDTHETPVIFRIPRGKQMAEMDDVTAYFPAECADYVGHLITCYAHVGQHGAADPYYMLHNTRIATPQEYADLKEELESAPYGYRLKIVRRRTKKHRAECIRQARALR